MREVNATDYEKSRACELDPDSFLSLAFGDIGRCAVDSCGSCRSNVETAFVAAAQVIRNLKADRVVFERQRDQANKERDKALEKMEKMRSDEHNDSAAAHQLRQRLRALQAANEKLVELLGQQELELNRAAVP